MTRLLAMAALVALAGCAAPPLERKTEDPADPARYRLEIVSLESPAPVRSAQSRVVCGADGKTYLSWIEKSTGGSHALRFSVLEKDAWSTPSTIATGDDWFVNWADFPSMAVTADGVMAAHWAFFPTRDDALARPDLAPEGTRELNILDVPGLILDPDFPDPGSRDPGPRNTPIKSYDGGSAGGGRVGVI